MPNHCDATVDKLVIKQAKTNRPNEGRETETLSITNINGPTESVIQGYLEKQDDNKDRMLKLKFLAKVTFIVTITAFILSVIAITHMFTKLACQRWHQRKSKLLKRKLQIELPQILDGIDQDNTETESLPVHTMINEYKTVIEQNKQRTPQVETTIMAKQISGKVQVTDYIQ